MASNTRPLLTYTFLIAIVMVGLGVLLSQLTRSYFVNIYEDRIASESQLIVSVLENRSRGDQQDPLYEISQQLNIGIVILGENGERFVDTTQVVEGMTEQQTMNVIHQFMQGDREYKVGRVIGDTFYYPVRVMNENRALLLLSSATSLTTVTKNIWLLIAVTLSLGLIAIFLIGFNLFSKYVRPIRSASAVATELVKGNYKARTYEANFGEAGQLSRSINILARNLQEMTSSKGMQENQLEAVINNMGNGLVLIDEKGYILLVNRAFLQTFGGENKEYIGYLYHDSIPYTAIHETVRKIYMFEETVSETFVLPMNIDRIHLDVTGAPIFSENNKWKGVVLVFHDISELKQLEQTRKDFVANVSHELRTPITSIRGFSETLLDGAMKDEAMLQQFLQIILKESGRLQSLIQDLLELSKLEKEDFHLNLETIDMKRLLEDLWPVVEHHAASKGIQLKKEWSSHVRVQGDSSRLKQVVMNLVTNAINYTTENGEVSLKLEENKEDVLLSVADNGVGIPEEEISRIFERFYRVDKARSRNSGGTGLGLAIVKHIVEGHGGTIEVRSKVDEGTTFYVRIPKKFTEN